MAGMLPGVECARRRRCHQGGGAAELQSPRGHGRTRRPSFCLYTSNFDAHINASPSLSRNQSLFKEEKLVGVAREAKERLDERLRNQRKSTETKRQQSKKSEANNAGGSSCVEADKVPNMEPKKGSGSGGSKRLSWANKLRWKVFEQEECAVCLEQFSAEEKLMELPCAHRFHSRCLVPWLESNAHCPCCRMGISNLNVLA